MYLRSAAAYSLALGRKEEEANIHYCSLALCQTTNTTRNVTSCEISQTFPPLRIRGVLPQIARFGAIWFTQASAEIPPIQILIRWRPTPAARSATPSWWGIRIPNLQFRLLISSQMARHVELARSGFLLHGFRLILSQIAACSSRSDGPMPICSFI